MTIVYLGITTSFFSGKKRGKKREVVQQLGPASCLFSDCKRERDFAASIETRRNWYRNYYTSYFCFQAIPNSYKLPAADSRILIYKLDS